MFFFLAFFYVFSLVYWTDGEGISNRFEENMKKYNVGNREITPRGIYGFSPYHHPFFEPLNILGLIGFLLFIAQTFHSLYKANEGGLLGGGGLINNILPGSRQPFVSSRRTEEILNSIKTRELQNNPQKNKKRRKRIVSNMVDNTTEII